MKALRIMEQAVLIVALLAWTATFVYLALCIFAPAAGAT